MWTTAFVNDLPDSAFLFVESGGDKDDDGKTKPRSLRHFPYRNASGDVDLPHLRNALSRLPQSSLSADEVEKLQAQARNLLDDETKEKSGRRMAGRMIGRLADAAMTIADLIKWGKYEDADPDDEDEKTKDGTFMVFKDTTGSYRWVSFSSNAFEDREKEIVSTKALEFTVKRGDMTGDRGTLRLFHIPGGDIGRCDFQGIEGRFLVESGVFDNTPMADKAIDYFLTTKDKLGTSIGYHFPEMRFKDGVYNDQISIFERSVCPHSAVANPWTSFSAMIQKGDLVDERKKDWARRVLGEDMAATLIDAAQSATKTLESSVRFKEGTPAEGTGEAEKDNVVTQLRAAINGLSDGEQKDTLVKAYNSAFPKKDDKKEDEKKEEKEEEKTEGTDEKADDGLVEILKEALAPITAALVSLKTDVTSVKDDVTTSFTEVRKDMETIGSRIKALEEPEPKTKEDSTPRGASYRATTATDNLLDKDKATDLLGETNPPVSVVAPYIADLIGSKA